MKAAGKERRTRIESDADAVAEHEKAVAKNVVRSSLPVRHRDELPTKQVVNIMADEIQSVYAVLGMSIDDLNAKDKALNIWRHMHIKGHVTAREQDMDVVLCAEHRED